MAVENHNNYYTVGYKEKPKVRMHYKRKTKYRKHHRRYRHNDNIDIRIGQYHHIENVDPLIELENDAPRKQGYTRYASSIESNFLRYGYYNADEDPFLTGNTYIFMTRPYLNLNGQNSEYNFYRNNFIRYIASSYRNLINILCYEIKDANFNLSFIPLISNRFKKIDMNDVSLNDVTSNETWKGYSVRMGTTYAGSVNGGSLNITYDEMQIPKVTYLHKVWLEYIEAVKSGMMSPSKNSLNYKELDYVSSVYVFGLMPDGETINFWAKYTGVFPKSLPYSSLVSGKGEIGIGTDISIEYGYSFREIYDVEILNEFNYVSAGRRLALSSGNGGRSDTFDVKNHGDLYSVGYKYDLFESSVISNLRATTEEQKLSGIYGNPYISYEKINDGSDSNPEYRFKLKFA